MAAGHPNRLPQRLPPEDELPAIDVFVCTTDPKTEKLSIYLSWLWTTRGRSSWFIFPMTAALPKRCAHSKRRGGFPELGFCSAGSLRWRIGA
nr:cellulose synthase-like protein G2 [Ipomoea trifida]